MINPIEDSLKTLFENFLLRNSKRIDQPASSTRPMNPNGREIVAIFAMKIFAETVRRWSVL